MRTIERWLDDSSIALLVVTLSAITVVVGVIMTVVYLCGVK